MISLLWAVVALLCRQTNAQLFEQGNTVEFPASFGMAGGLLSGMLGFVDIFDPSFGSHSDPPSLQGFTSSGATPPSSDQSSLNQPKPGQDSLLVPSQGTGWNSSQMIPEVVDSASVLTTSQIPMNEQEGITVTVPINMFPRDVTTPLLRRIRSPPPLNMVAPQVNQSLQPKASAPPSPAMIQSDRTNQMQPIPRDPPAFAMFTKSTGKPLQPVSSGSSPFNKSPRDDIKPMQPIVENPSVLDISPTNIGKRLQPIPRDPPSFDMSTKNETKPLQPTKDNLTTRVLSSSNDTKPFQPIIRGPPPFDMSPRDGVKPLQAIQGDSTSEQKSPTNGDKSVQPIIRSPPSFDMSTKNETKPSQPTGNLTTLALSPSNDNKPFQPIIRGPPPFDMSPKDGAKPLQPIEGESQSQQRSPLNGDKPVQPIIRGPPPFDMSSRDGTKPLKPISGDLPTPSISQTNVIKPLQPMSSKNVAKPLQPISIDPQTVDVTLSKDPTSLPPNQRAPPTFGKSTPARVTQTPKLRDPIFIEKSSLGRTKSIKIADIDLSQSVSENATAKEVNRLGQNLGTGANMESFFSGLVDPGTNLFGGMPEKRRASLEKTSETITKQDSNLAPVSTRSQQTKPVIRTITTQSTNSKTTIRPDPPTTPISNQEILQMLNSFSSRRIVLGRSQGKPQDAQRSNSPPTEKISQNNSNRAQPRAPQKPSAEFSVNKEQGQAPTGGQNSVPISSLATARGGNLNMMQNPAPSGLINSGLTNSGQGGVQSQVQGQSQRRGMQSPNGSSQQVVVDGFGVIDFDQGALDLTGWTNILLGLLNRL